MSLGLGVGDSIFGKNFYGISKSNLEAVKTIILDYQKSVEKDLDSLCQEVNSGTVSKAVKGEELTASIQAFVVAVKQEAKEWSTQMNKYVAAIDEVIAGYTVTEKQSASTLDTSNQSVSSQTESYSYGGSSNSAS